MTTYVKMIVGGKLCEVPTEHSKKVAQKEALVAKAMELNQKIAAATHGYDRFMLQSEQAKLASKIISLNRRIPPCVRPVR